MDVACHPCCESFPEDPMVKPCQTLEDIFKVVEHLPCILALDHRRDEELGCWLLYGPKPLSHVTVFFPIPHLNPGGGAGFTCVFGITTV